MIRRALICAIAPLFFVVAGCAYKEVVPETKCQKIVGVKYYKPYIFGVIPDPGVSEMVVLEDGSEMKYSSAMFVKNPVTGEICRTTYSPKQPR